MDVGGLNWLIIDVIAVAVLLAVLVWLVMRTRSKGKETSNPGPRKPPASCMRPRTRRPKKKNSEPRAPASP